MDQQCHGCGNMFPNGGGQLVRRDGNYVCVSCYSQASDGLSPEARRARADRLAGRTGAVASASVRLAAARKRVRDERNARASTPRPPAPKPAMPMSEAPRLEVVGEPILEDQDDELSF